VRLNSAAPSNGVWRCVARVTAAHLPGPFGGVPAADEYVEVLRTFPFQVVRGEAAEVVGQ
jgi:hypothetical protein